MKRIILLFLMMAYVCISELTVDENEKYDALFCSDDSLMRNMLNTDVAIGNLCRLAKRLLFVICKDDDSYKKLATTMTDNASFTEQFSYNEVASNVLNYDCRRINLKHRIILYNTK